MTPAFYDLVAHGCAIRNVCPEDLHKHWHTIIPAIYDTDRFPGNWLGWAVACDGDLEAVCARVNRLSGVC